MENLPQQLQTPLSQKQKSFSGPFIDFLKLSSNLKHFQEKYESASLNISEIIDSEIRGYLNV